MLIEMWIILVKELRRQMLWRNYLNILEAQWTRALGTWYSTHFIGFGDDTKWNGRAEVQVWLGNSRWKLEVEPLHETGEEEEELHFGKSLPSTDPPSWNKMQKGHKKISESCCFSIGRRKPFFISSCSEKGLGSQNIWMLCPRYE